MKGPAHVSVETPEMTPLPALEPAYLGRAGLVAALLTLLLLPLKLSFAYLPITVLVVLRFAAGRAAWRQPLPRTLIPFAVLGALFAVVSCFGVAPGRSFAHIPSFFVSLIIADTFYELARRYTMWPFLLALLGGQAIASLYTVAEAFFPGLPVFFLGPVSEAGQLAMTVVLAIGLVVQAHEKGVLSLRHLLGSIAIFAAILALAVTPRSIFATLPLRLLVLALGVLAILYVIQRLVRRQTLAMPHLLVFLVCPLLSFALVANLKRGPWTGVACGIFVLLLLHARRFLIPVTVVGFLVLCLPPVQSRLANSASDFFVKGGRSDIWEIGHELVLRFPLGVGFENARFLQQFSVAVPPELTHFHNNALNILVEGGWIALAVFAWWLVTLANHAFSRAGPERFNRSIFGAALIAWQVAGIVEYNIGDTEVFYVALTCIGLLAAFEPGTMQEAKKTGLTAS